jgi:Flp pilus assembly protein TadD
MAGRLEPAEAGLREAIALHPTNERAHLLLAALLANQGRTDQAVEVLRDALLMLPTRDSIHRQLAKVYLDRSEPENAARQIRYALGFQPDDRALRLSLAEALTSAGDDRAAVAVLREELDRAGDAGAEDAAVALALAGILATSEDPEIRDPHEAAKLAEAAARQPGASRGTVLQILSIAYAGTGRLDEAIAVTEDWLRQAELTSTPEAVAAVRKRLHDLRARRSDRP